MCNAHEYEREYEHSQLAKRYSATGIAGTSVIYSQYDIQFHTLYNVDSGSGKCSKVY